MLLSLYVCLGARVRLYLAENFDAIQAVGLWCAWTLKLVCVLVSVCYAPCSTCQVMRLTPHAN